MLSVDPKPLGQQLRDLRLRAGLTLAEVARRAGTSIPTMHRYESGWDRFSIQTLRNLAAALEADLQVRLIPRRLDTDLGTEPEKLPRDPEELMPLIEDLFWERDLDAEAISRYPVWVLVRVLNMGSLRQVRSSVGFFGRDVLQEALGSRDLDPRAKRFWRIYLRRSA